MRCMLYVEFSDLSLCHFMHYLPHSPLKIYLRLEHIFSYMKWVYGFASPIALRGWKLSTISSVFQDVHKATSFTSYCRKRNHSNQKLNSTAPLTLKKQNSTIVASLTNIRRQTKNESSDSPTFSSLNRAKYMSSSPISGLSQSVALSIDQ